MMVRETPSCVSLDMNWSVILELVIGRPFIRLRTSPQGGAVVLWASGWIFTKNSFGVSLSLEERRQVLVHTQINHMEELQKKSFIKGGNIVIAFN